MNKILIVLVLFLSSLFSNEFFYIKDNKKVYLEKIEDISRDVSNKDYYKDENNNLLGVNKNIILALKQNISIEKYLQKYNLKILKNIDENLFLVSVDNKSKTLEISNSLNKEIGVSFAQPDFIKEVHSR